MSTRAIPLLDAVILRQAALDAVREARAGEAGAQSGDVRHGRRRATRHAVVGARSADGQGGLLFSGQIAAWLWFTVLFANFAEAIAEGRGKAHADALAGDAQRNDGQAPAAPR